MKRAGQVCFRHSSGSHLSHSIQKETTMAKSPSSLHQPIPASMLVTLARQKALNAVKLDLRDHGLKVWYLEQKVLVAAANQYLKDHPELFAQAAESVRNCPKLSAMAERE